MSDTERLNLRVSPEWLEAIDDARGHEPRAAFIKRTVLAFIVLHEAGAELARASGVEPSARKPPEKPRAKAPPADDVLDPSATELPRIGRKASWKS